MCVEKRAAREEKKREIDASKPSRGKKGPSFFSVDFLLRPKRTAFVSVCHG
jgi:hypothetical protein